MFCVGQARKHRRLRPCAVPSVFQWSKIEPASSVDRRNRAIRRAVVRDVTATSVDAADVNNSEGDVVADVEIEFAAEITVGSNAVTDMTEQSTTSNTTQTDFISVSARSVQTDHCLEDFFVF